MSACEYVVLKGGLTVPLDVLRLCWELEDRGVRIGAKNADTLLVGPRRLLRDEDRAALKHWKAHILVLVNHEATVPGEVS